MANFNHLNKTDIERFFQSVFAERSHQLAAAKEMVERLKGTREYAVITKQEAETNQ